MKWDVIVIVCIIIYVVLLEEATRIAWVKGRRWGIIYIYYVFEGSDQWRNQYCTGRWGKTGYYLYIMLLEEGTRIAWAECEDAAL